MIYVCFLPPPRSYIQGSPVHMYIYLFMYVYVYIYVYVYLDR